MIFVTPLEFPPLGFLALVVRNYFYRMPIAQNSHEDA
jgi:hypothetical protein